MRTPFFPPELVDRIISYCDNDTIKVAGRVSKSWLSTSRPYFWPLVTSFNERNAPDFLSLVESQHGTFPSGRPNVFRIHHFEDIPWEEVYEKHIEWIERVAKAVVLKQMTVQKLRLELPESTGQIVKAIGRALAEVLKRIAVFEFVPEDFDMDEDIEGELMSALCELVAGCSQLEELTFQCHASTDGREVEHAGLVLPKGLKRLTTCGNSYFLFDWILSADEKERAQLEELHLREDVDAPEGRQIFFRYLLSPTSQSVRHLTFSSQAELEPLPLESLTNLQILNITVQVYSSIINDGLFPFLLSTLESLPTGANSTLKQLDICLSFKHVPADTFTQHFEAEECKELDMMLAGEQSKFKQVKVGLWLEGQIAFSEEKSLEMTRKGYSCCSSAQERGLSVVISTWTSEPEDDQDYQAESEPEEGGDEDISED